MMCRVPLQYLNNCCHWRDLILAVGPSVLIPRPETELLIDFAQQVLTIWIGTEHAACLSRHCASRSLDRLAAGECAGACLPACQLHLQQPRCASLSHAMPVHGC